ncbi:MAG: hypothetical protein ABH951_02145 [Patescibacteria group bacterium]
MKINFLKLNKEKQFKKPNFDINVDFYWELLLIISLALVIFAFVFGSYLFMKINKEFILPEIKTSGQLEKVKKERINNVFDYFTEKESKSISIMEFPSPIVDPSK